MVTLYRCKLVYSYLNYYIECESCDLSIRKALENRRSK